MWQLLIGLKSLNKQLVTIYLYSLSHNLSLRGHGQPDSHRDLILHVRPQQDGQVAHHNNQDLCVHKHQSLHSHQQHGQAVPHDYSSQEQCVHKNQSHQQHGQDVPHEPNNQELCVLKHPSLRYHQQPGQDVPHEPNNQDLCAQPTHHNLLNHLDQHILHKQHLKNHHHLQSQSLWDVDVREELLLLQDHQGKLSAGFQDISLGERGGRRRDFHDLGVNTRQAMDHVKDSKTGFNGKPIPLSTNHIRLLSRPQWVLFQYHIDFNPPMESRRLRTALLYQHEELIGKARAFDGTILFLPRRLNKATEVFSQTKNKENVKITITLTNELPPTSPTCFQFYNIIFKRLLKMMNMKQIGRNYYNPNDAINIKTHSLNIWPGFSTSILQYETSIMLCIDVSHKVLRDETVHDIMSRNFDQYGTRFQDVSAKEVVGQIVLTKYNNRTYRIDEVFWNMSPLSTFKKYDGTDITFVDYYKTDQYGIVIKDMQQPLIANIPKKAKPGEPSGPLLLIPELCNLTGLTDRMRSDFTVMRDLAVHTRLPPDQREKAVGKFLNYIHKDEGVQKELRDWGLNFDTNLLRFNGRVANPERIQQSGRSVDYNPQFADWSREMRGQLLSVRHLESWILLYTRRNYDVANTLTQTLVKGSLPLERLFFQVTHTCSADTQLTRLTDNRFNSIGIPLWDIGAGLRQPGKNEKAPPSPVVCILSSIHKGKYDAIKKYLCADVPIPSQCVVARTLSKPQTIMSVASKIALQMNCKMGGELWSVEMPIKYYSKMEFRVIASKEIYPYLSCMNKGLTRVRPTGFTTGYSGMRFSWFSRCVIQDQKQEIVDGLKVCMLAALRAYESVNNAKPKRVLIYRDGVGDGQLKTLVNYEIPQFMDCLKSQDNPRLTVIVVKKRINARFFGVFGGRLQNPPPGTIVDVEVTRPEWYDFFIISQSVRVGTVSPTHYNVVYDNGGLTPDQMQRLTYKLCHLYYNWPGVIRVPAPCQYAHKLAFLVGQSIHVEPHVSLANKLYYL
ncbi:piwi 1 [Pelobates cultripes]|uniref:Piwi 1 n=1 Tax=Pelobates cultripes TaxID=61616 RepID=A0AAD1VS67_PELCU|nr:piwi 1 [Pelobates cultripes]